MAGHLKVLELIQRSTEYLGKRGVESPRLQAELLLAHVLKTQRMRLYLEFEREVPEPQVNEYREMIVRRGAREPLQHIVAGVCFCGLNFRVSREVLIPRQETELLAERGWGFLQYRARTDGDAVPTALDFGTGSGCLAITLAQKCPVARVTALDISQAALGVAAANAEANQVSNRTTFVQGSSLRDFAGQNFDLLISNPPYIPSAEIEGLSPEVKDFDPRRALDGGVDGLDFYRLLAREGREVLKPKGIAMLEFGDAQQPAVEKIFQDEMWVVEEVVQDYTQRPRILIAKLGLQSVSKITEDG